MHKFFKVTIKIKSTEDYFQYYPNKTIKMSGNLDGELNTCRNTNLRRLYIQKHKKNKNLRLVKLVYGFINQLIKK